MSVFLPGLRMPGLFPRHIADVVKRTCFGREWIVNFPTVGPDPNPRHRHHLHTPTPSATPTPPTHKVIVSNSTCIFENLAYEEWLFDNADLDRSSYLLIWRNEPTVVVGRHQNPWLESNVPLMVSEGVTLARRSSGGGTVYHDKGNINFCFLTSRERYNRKWNLNLVTEALNDRWMLDLSVNDRDNIMWQHMYKVSGTAARLKAHRAYHHFTLLLDVNLDRLQSLLHSPLEGAESRATASVPAAVVNLAAVEPSLTFDDVTQCVAHHFLLHHHHHHHHHITCNHDSQPPPIRYVDPTSESPEISVSAERLRDWDWIYGKTPTFSLRRHFYQRLRHGEQQTSLKIHCKVQNGRISELELEMTPPDTTRISDTVVDCLLSHRLCPQHLRHRLDCHLTSTTATSTATTTDTSTTATSTATTTDTTTTTTTTTPPLTSWFLNCLWTTLFGHSYS
ncbi:lipoyltransferase 1, mitochondrial-like [Argonauta hians]